VIPSVVEADFWSVDDTFEPAATGEYLSAQDWNERARSRNKVEYRIIGR
jgi:predicted sulfurtransferase